MLHQFVCLTEGQFGLPVCVCVCVSSLTVQFVMY